jgi:polyisoprenoid-binding protein YceI
MATWNVDTTHSSVSFSVRHMMFAKVRGKFSKFTAALEYDPAAPAAAKVEATIDVGSIDTNEGQRDGHLKSADFFDAANFPSLTFKSTKVEPKGKGLAVTGNLTIRGTTLPVVLDVEALGVGKDPWGNQRAGFHAKTKIDRTAFGLKWNQALEAGGVLVGTDIEIEIDLQAVTK